MNTINIEAKHASIYPNGIAAIGNGYNVLGGTMVLAVFPESYAIISLLTVILINSKLNEIIALVS